MMNINDLPHGTFTEVRGRLTGVSEALVTLTKIMSDPRPDDSVNMLAHNIETAQGVLDEAKRLLRAADQAKEGSDVPAVRQ